MSSHCMKGDQPRNDKKYVNKKAQKKHGDSSSFYMKNTYFSYRDSHRAHQGGAHSKQAASWRGGSGYYRWGLREGTMNLLGNDMERRQ